MESFMIQLGVKIAQWTKILKVSVSKAWLNSNVVKHLKSYLAIRSMTFGFWSICGKKLGHCLSAVQPRQLLAPSPSRKETWGMKTSSQIPSHILVFSKGLHTDQPGQHRSAWNSTISLRSSARPLPENLGGKTQCSSVVGPGRVPAYTT